MRLVWFLAGVCFCCGCTGTSKNSNRFQSEIFLKHTERNPSIVAWWPTQPFIVDSVLVVSSWNLGEDFVHFFSLTDFQDKGKFGKIGRGPGEFLYADAFHHNDSVFEIFDANKFSVTRFRLLQTPDTIFPQVISYRNIEPNEGDLSGSYTRLCRFNENYYMAACYKDQDRFFVLLDSNLRFCRYFGNAPIQEKADNYDVQMQGLCVAAHGIMVFGGIQYPYLGCYTLQDSVPVKCWEDVYYDSYYIVDNNKIKFSKSKSRGRMVGLSISPRYIYVAFNEGLLSEVDMRRSETYTSDLIFVFDHQGNHIGRLKLDVPVVAMCVSDDGKTLYGITEVPDYALVTFTLPEWGSF